MAYTQDNRKAAITTPLGKDVLLLEAFSGAEAISEPFSMRARLLAEVDTTVALPDLVGKSVTIRAYTPAGDRYFNGIVSRISEGASDTSFTTYDAEIVPWLWLLTHNANCRIFQNKTVPDIIKVIFGDHGMTDFALQLQGSYQPREYCVQYRETDFNFVARLMEQYGIFYYFKHEDGKHTLVLADTPDGNVPCPTQPTARFHAEEGVLTEHVVNGWRHEVRFPPGKYTLGDFNFEMPSVDLTVNTASALPNKSKFEIYDYPGEYQKRADGETLVKLRIQAEESQATVVDGGSTCAGFVSGHRFELQEHPKRDRNGSYVLTRVSHHGEEPGYRSRTATFAYQNQFQCMPWSVPFRPQRRTPRPVVEGVQTATVVGVAGEEIYTDKYGRVKVQFHWDRVGKKDENSSCWVRVSTPWAGKQWGGVSIPRIGQEVIVDFLEGDPDQPIITGRVYNAEQMPPYALPSGGVISGLKSSSTKGGGGFNEISMNDTKGKEKIVVHGQYDMETTILHNRSESIGVNETVTVGSNRNESVGGNETIAISGNRTETVSKDEALSITGARTTSVRKDESLSITGNRTVSIGKNEALTIQGDRSVSIAKGDTLAVGKALLIDAADGITLKTGDASITMKKDGTIVIKGKDITVEGSGKINMKASKDIVMKGSKITQN